MALFPLMLKFSLEINFKVTQRSTAAIFEMLIFRDSVGGQSPKYSQIGKNFNFDPLKYCKKSKTALVRSCIIPNLSTNQI